MSLVVFEDVSLSLGGKTIVEDLDLRIGDKDRIGLVGPNGAGKSTILRMLAGTMAPDGGELRRRKGLRLGYLPQDVIVEGGRRLLPFVLESVPGRVAIEEELDGAHQELERLQAGGDPESEEALLEVAGSISELTEMLAHFETEFSAHRAERILMGLGFKVSDLDRDLGELSGGWRMRALLASLLFQQPDLLLLDEPTNHLDMPSVAWLSGFLKRYSRAFILISHDREFLNEQIDRVVSFEVEGIRSYPGNYEHYRRQREEELTLLEARAKNIEKKREELERFVERFRAKASKAKQAQSRAKAIEKLEKIDLPQARQKMRFRFPPAERSGRDVMKGTGLCKAYGEKVVLDAVDVTVERGDRIAIIGVNGAGKTTLLRMLAGELARDAGEVELGHNVKLGFYAQHHTEMLNPSSSVYDEVRSRSRTGGQTHIRSILGALMLGEDDIEKKIGVLSGGERARVALACLLVDPGNLLLMDEPTNHLDLDSSESLAQALTTFDGTLLFVSHNRGFLRTLANKIWYVDEGRVEVYPGTLDDYMESVRSRLDGETPGALDATGEELAKKTRDAEKARKRREAELRNERNRKLGPLKKRIDELEANIARLEAEQKKRGEELSDPKVYEDPQKREQLTKDFHRGSVELEVLTETWMECNEEYEALSADLN